MTKFSETRRKLLRTIYHGLGAATISTMFQGCSIHPFGFSNNPNPPPPYGGPGPMYGPIGMYGPPGPGQYDVLIHGTVFSESTGAPIPGIMVSAKDFSISTLTDTAGNFTYFVPMRDSYKLKFENRRVWEGGLFQTQKVKITLEETKSPLYVYLSDENVSDEADEE
jgi:hypothetical protein